jgi:hypothetical protein
MDREELVTVRVLQGDSCESPRTDRDNCDVMYCQHSRYNLGDKDADDPYEVEEGLEVDGVWLNTDELSYIVDMLELLQAELLGDQAVEDWVQDSIDELSDPPGGLEERRKLRDDISLCLPLYLYDHSRITISHGSFGCPWDSGQVGWHYITKKTLQDEWGGDEALAERYMRATLEEYDQYLRGNCWGFNIEGPGVDDSCWGFIGDELEKIGMFDYVEERFHNALREAWEKRFDPRERVYCTVEGEVVDPDELEALIVRKQA